MGFISLSGVLVLSVLVGLMMSNWFTIILSMELGLFVFIFMCLSYNSLSYARSCFKYFIIQSLSSLLLFLGGLTLFGLYKVDNSLCHIMFHFGFLMKLGGFPMLFWVIPVMLELPYVMIGVMGCPLKVIPLMLYNEYYSMFNTMSSMYTMGFVSLMTMLFGVWLGLYMKTIRGVLGASSVTHTGWFILSVGSSSLYQYFFLYSVSFLLVLYTLIYNNLFVSSLNILGLAGLPPFSVFVGKMSVIKASFESNISSLFTMLALLVSSISLYYYLKFSFNMYMYTTPFAQYNSFMLSTSIISNCFFGLLYCLMFF
nr:NADH dehydrogenase subunit 2 [Candidula unifasciata unifasciata]